MTAREREQRGVVLSFGLRHLRRWGGRNRDLSLEVLQPPFGLFPERSQSPAPPVL